MLKVIGRHYYSIKFLCYFPVALIATCWTQELGCPASDWQLSGETCYYISSDDSQTWDSANQMCQTLGGQHRDVSVYR